MAKNKPPKLKTKEELKSWVRSVGKENIDLASLKRAHRRIKKNK